MTILILLPLLSYLVSAFLLLISKKKSSSSGLIALAGSLIAALCGIFPVVHVLGGQGSLDFMSVWNLPLGSFHLHMDLLSAWFCIPVLFISVLAVCYGIGYMSHYKTQYSVKYNWFFLQLLSGGMYFVLLAWDGILFLMAWEIMSFAAWFLVMFDHKKKEVRRAGWVYLAATHLGTAFLFAMFIIASNESGSFDFNHMAGLSASVNILFILALIGFGSKAGLFGLHVWLPEAHPAAPSHVSGLMSGVMIKAGIYGLIRMVMFMDVWSPWWGWTLIAIGICSGLGGVLYAVVQHDLKQLLAYSSVENIGIICMGFGIGILGLSYGNPAGIIGIAGALLHVLNHSVFKTVLFLSAGSVAHATGTRNIDSMGGLARKMPVTSGIFVIASLSICGLPPFNGFVSEVMIYLSSYKSAIFNSSMNTDLMLAALAVISVLALIGGLAVMCFTKVFGVVFLGESRTDCCQGSEDPPPSMLWPMIILVFCCALLGFGGAGAVQMVIPVAQSVCSSAAYYGGELTAVSKLMGQISILMAAFILFCLLLWALRAYLQKNRTISQGPTWGCGYQHGTGRMQYTGSSYVEPLLYAFRTLFHSKYKAPGGRDILPEESYFSSHTPDLFMKFFYTPLFSFLASFFAKLRIIQNGRLNLYIFYIILTLGGILIWGTL
ncbi:MAG: hypothetical protein B6241_02010 [Spirochaetaceae bacterium 4572_59]|nr:MAG: hypothetical protein B6241_02010 [Spirochaetaceae bacterium 4572_59]